MLQKIKKWKLAQSGVVGISLWLVLLANISASSACWVSWHEPDCPDELLR